MGLDYEAMDEEHRRLQVMIRQVVNNNKAEPKDQTVMRVVVPNVLDSREGSSFDRRGTHSVTAKVYITHNGPEDLENLTLIVDCPQPFQTDQGSVAISSLRSSSAGPATPLVVPIVFSSPPDIPSPVTPEKVLLPTSLMVHLILAFLSPNGEPLTCKASFVLPLCLAGTIIPPVKNSQFKITLDTNRMPPQLPVLFDDVCSTSDPAAGNVLSFQYFNSNASDATILVSKNAGRYRIQSSSFEALWLLTSELVRRLKMYFGGDTDKHSAPVEPMPGLEGDLTNPNAPFAISYTENLPFQEYFTAIDGHFKSRQQLAASQQTLSERAHQFRSIQKRLLVRFKDRNPAPLANLDLLFEDTYKLLMDVADEVETNQAALTHAANSLTCCTNLMLLLIRYRFNLAKEDMNILKHYLSPVVVDSTSQGWEECTDAAMTHLLRTCLAKSAKESSSMPQPLSVPQDVNKLKKHIALVCDRIAKGGSLRGDATTVAAPSGGPKKSRAVSTTGSDGSTGPSG
eukprot:NODE_173_length_1924_cov_98.348800_g130_i0.p2 GENE.NODE_173_length_1924_cov_98.348800_g130_i0~~NODE_173_length_1924_cov_98.348800_g130_i0.p2  ORF type:complete len:512 (-),score=206.18 NODE_173_length_1924_cov_98.348800_g130_i0:356-1891(-)